MSVKKINAKELRDSYGMSQEDLALRLGISRPTLIKIEKGERPLKISEKRKLEDIFGLVASVESESKNTNIRISIPQKNIEKFKQVFLYLLEKVGSKPNVGMTVIYKLLYFIDFDYYEKYEEQIMGLTYFRNHHGPAPREFAKVVDRMKEDEEVEAVNSKFFTYDQKKFLPRKKADLGSLSGKELEMIDDVIARYGDRTAKELSRISHEDMPWAAAKPGADLEYDHVFYRPDNLSVREFEEL